jgi:hypothetical protein
MMRVAAKQPAKTQRFSAAASSMLARLHGLGLVMGFRECPLCCSRAVMLILILKRKFSALLLV